MNLFQLAAFEKWRFEGPQGQALTVEDLCHIGRVEKGLTELDAIAIELDKKLKQRSVSFVKEVSLEDAQLKNQFELVIEIIDIRKELYEQSKAISAKSVEKARIKAILAEKQEDNLKNMTTEQLMQKLAELENN